MNNISKEWLEIITAVVNCGFGNVNIVFQNGKPIRFDLTKTSIFQANKGVAKRQTEE